MPKHDAYTVERAWMLLAFGENLSTERERRNVTHDALADIGA